MTSRFGYTVSIPNRGTMTNLHPFQLVVGNATPNVSFVDRTGLTSEIVKAEAVEQGSKTDKAFSALQQAIAERMRPSTPPMPRMHPSPQA